MNIPVGMENRSSQSESPIEHQQQVTNPNKPFMNAKIVVDAK